MTSIVPMAPADITQVLEIDRLSFPLPWSYASYRHELAENKNAHFFVALRTPRRSWRNWFRAPRGRLVVGFVGYWYILDEAHISTIGVHPRWRGHGIGEQLLVAALKHAIGLGAVEATLEVRASNTAALNLYHKHGFEEVGRRKNYYRDNDEDALLMTARPLRVNELRNDETMNNVGSLKRSEDT